MQEKNPIVFDHVSALKGQILNERELSEFVAGIASSLLEERGIKVISACRMVMSETPMLIAEDKVYAISYDMFPKSAEITDGEKVELAAFSRSLARAPYCFPISLFCLDGDGDKPLSGAGYIVKDGDVEKI